MTPKHPFAGLKDRLRIPRLAAQARLSPLMLMVLAFLACASLLAAVFAAYALLGPEGGGAGEAAPDWKPPALSIVELDPPKAAAANAEALTRPIFMKNRRPNPRASARALDSIGSGGGPSGVALGAIVKAGGTEKVFVTSSQAPEGEWKSVGDMIDAWTIEAIIPDSVIVKNGEQVARIKLYPEQPEEQPSSPQTQPGAQ